MGEIGRGPFDAAVKTESLYMKAPCVDDSEKDLENAVVEIDVNGDDEYKRAVIQFDHYEDSDTERNSEPEKEIDFYGYEEAEFTVYGLESITEKTGNDLPEYFNIQEELSRVLDEINASKEHVFIPETEIELVSNQAEKGKESMEVETECSTERVVKTERDLEAELLEKSLLVDSLQSGLRTATELQCSVEKVAFDAIREANVLKALLELKEVNILEQECDIDQLETEAEGLKTELLKASEENTSLVKKIDEMIEELDVKRNKENEAEIEIALLKSEIHKGRSRLAAAEAALERAKVEKSAINAALHQLAVELHEAKTENNELKESIENKTTEEDSNKVDFNVMISKEEYEVLLIKNSELANQVQNMMDQENYKTESEQLKKELQIATAKIAELRSRAEHAISRAEAAENVKETLEERVKRWKEQRAVKKMATTLHAESKNILEEDGNLRYKSVSKVHHLPLGKILNMKY